MPRPDPFVVYLSGLLLGQIGPMKSNLNILERRVLGDGDCAVRVAALLARKHLRALHCGHDPSGAPVRLPLPV
jgi:hypothetical protein